MEPLRDSNDKALGGGGNRPSPSLPTEIAGLFGRGLSKALKGAPGTGLPVSGRPPGLATDEVLPDACA